MIVQSIYHDVLVHKIKILLQFPSLEILKISFWFFFQIQAENIF